MPLLLISACDCSKEIEPLLAELELTKQDVARREIAAQDCEDQLDTETERNDDLARRIRAELPLSLPPDVLTQDVIAGLQPEQRVIIEDQINEYLIEVARELEELKEMNKSLTQIVVGVGKKVEVESQKIRAETSAQTAAIEDRVAGHQEQLQTYLKTIKRVSGTAERLIDQIKDFEQESINCKGCWSVTRYKKRKRVILAFHANLIGQIAELQDIAPAK